MPERKGLIEGQEQFPRYRDQHFQAEAPPHNGIL